MTLTKLPADWEVKSLGQLGRVVRGASPRPAGDPRYFNGTFIPWLTVASLTAIPASQLRVERTASGLTEEGAKRSRTLQPETVVISNSGATLGVAKVLGIKCCANDGIAAIVDQHSGDKYFLCYYLNTQTTYLRDVVASGNGQPNLNTSLIREIQVPLPPESEQLAIARVLADADSLLESLGALIVKKRAIKQGLMQELLAGRTRLSGFSEPWRVVRLGHHVSYVKNVALSRAQLDSSSPLRCLHYGDIHTRSTPVLNASEEEMPRAPKALARNAGFLQVGDLVFADASEDPDGVGKSVEITGVPIDGVVPGLHTIAARFDKRVLADGFKAYLQNIEIFRQQLLALAAGTKVLATTRSYISSVELNLPGVAEQSAIAAVLQDADAEIETLERRLKAIRAIKQGLMQELLTGRTRLIAEGAA
ncbi:restriction endonuclease subunit S [Nonomuraea sp. NPDC049421]|uniref:restriction endonuclease subunit S n=1 Tax=Nonomuraea sp. NPDC049421 TaxID=3155275 RepID=UPI00344850F0